MNCKTCKYYEQYGVSAMNTGVGKCRRFPPVSDNQGDATVDEPPVVREDGWCGEHKK